jgi:tetratricopeptide (TPR) repeat protein
MPHYLRLNKSYFALALVFFSVIFSTLSFAAQDDITKQAETLIRKGDFNAAYQLLEPLETARAGDVDYDYLLGVAGVESGNVTRGAFALERVLATNPNHTDARAEMAKAHFILGETAASKAEFNNVLALNPDAETKKTIEKLLTAIQKIEGTTTTFGAYLGFGLGYDSNVSSAPSISSIGVPAFGGLLIELDPSARELSDGFMNLSGGVSVRHPISDKLAAFGSASGTRRINHDETAFDNSSLDFNAGLQYTHNQHNFSFALQDSHFDLDDDAFRHAYGGTAQWMYNIDAKNQAGLYTQYSRLKYNGNDFRNAERYILGANAAHVFEGDFSPVLFASIYGGREVARDPAADFLSQDIVGVRAGGQLSFNSKWQLQTSLAYERRDNDEDEPSFLKKRSDNQYDASLGLNYIPTRDWSIRPQVTYSKVDSNIELYSFDRHIISVDVRKDFSW